MFIEAGLGEPALFCEVPVGGAEALVIPWMVQTLKSVLPEVERLGLAGANRIGLDTLEFRTRRAARQAGMQITAPMQFCAWSRVKALPPAG